MLKPQFPVFVVVTTLALAPASEAVPIPLPGAFVSASTQTGTSSSSDPSTSSIIRTTNSSDFSEGQAGATVGGPVRARSMVDAASGQRVASSASSTAQWIGNFTTGGSDPGAAIDINFDLSVDGFLSYLNNNSGAELNDIITAMELTVSAHDTTGAQTLFDGAASIRSQARGTPAAFTFSGFSAGDFTGTCGVFRCDQSLDASISLSPLLVGFGSVFAIELSLMTEAFAFAGQEIASHSNFFNTVNIDLSTTTQGVFIESVGGTTPSVPLPGTLALLGVGLLSLTTYRRG